MDRRRRGQTMLRSEDGWTLLAQLGQLKTELVGKGLLKIICGASAASQGCGIKTLD